MAICKHCGANIDDNAKFCGSCGCANEVIPTMATPVESTPVEPTYVEPTPTVEATPVNSVPTYEQPQQNFNQTYQQTAFSQPMYEQPVNNKTNICALVGFIFSIVSLICCSFLAPIGAILSIIGLVQIKKSGEKGKGLAIAGLIIGVIGTLLTIISFILIFAYPTLMTGMDFSEFVNGYNYY